MFAQDVCVKTMNLAANVLPRAGFAQTGARAQPSMPPKRHTPTCALPGLKAGTTHWGSAPTGQRVRVASWIGVR